MLRLVIILNIVTLPFFIYAMLRYTFSRQMSTAAIEGVDEKYRLTGGKRGPRNRLPTPEFDYYHRKRRINWKYRKLKRDCQYAIYGPLKLRNRHVIASVIHLALTGMIVSRLQVEYNEPHLLMFGVAYVVLVLWMNVLFHFFTRSYPFLSGEFHSRPAWVAWLAAFSIILMMAAGLAYLAGAYAESGRLEPDLAIIVPPFAYFIVVFLLRWLRVKRVVVSRKNLLILRVFGSIKRSFFIFNRLQPLWNNVGSVFTIVSPDQLTNIMFFWRAQKAPLILFLLVFATTLFSQLGIAKQDLFSSNEYAKYIFASGLLLAHYGIVYFPFRMLVRSAFIDHESQLYEEIMRSVETAPKKGFFSNVYYSCRDDNWRATVEGIAGIADVVLMDLRGFTELNLGTAFEIGFMVNHVPVENVVVLVDKTTDLDAIRSMLADEWKQMRKDSPNHSKKQLRLAIYRGKRLRKRDLYPIAALLCNHSLRQDQLQLDEKTLRMLQK